MSHLKNCWKRLMGFSFCFVIYQTHFCKANEGRFVEESAGRVDVQGSYVAHLCDHLLV